MDNDDALDQHILIPNEDATVFIDRVAAIATTMEAIAYEYKTFKRPIIGQKWTMGAADESVLSIYIHPNNAPEQTVRLGWGNQDYEDFVAIYIHIAGFEPIEVSFRVDIVNPLKIYIASIHNRSAGYSADSFHGELMEFLDDYGVKY